MSRKYYTDSYNITSEQIKENGTIDITATVAKVGVYAYGKDRVYVGSEVLSDPDWISALNGSIYTSFHDPTMFTATKGKMHMVGAVSEAVFDEETQSNHVKIRIWDTLAYQQIKDAGKIFLSCGYYADTASEVGEYQDQTYNFKQVKRTHCDHVAATNAPRHGHSCVLDEEEACNMEEENVEKENMTTALTQLMEENERLKFELKAKNDAEMAEKSKKCDQYTLDDVKQLVDMANTYGVCTDRKAGFSYSKIRNAILAKQSGLKNVETLDDVVAETAFQVLKKCYIEQQRDRNVTPQQVTAVPSATSFQSNTMRDSEIDPLVLRGLSNCINGELLKGHLHSSANTLRQYCAKSENNSIARSMGIFIKK